MSRGVVPIVAPDPLRSQREAGVAIPRDLFAEILRRIDRLRPNIAPADRSPVADHRTGAC